MVERTLGSFQEDEVLQDAAAKLLRTGGGGADWGQVLSRRRCVFVMGGSCGGGGVFFFSRNNNDVLFFCSLPPVLLLALLPFDGHRQASPLSSNAVFNGRHQDHPVQTLGMAGNAWHVCSVCL